jgi:hypothetical protein
MSLSEAQQLANFLPLRLQLRQRLNNRALPQRRIRLANPEDLAELRLA